MKFRKIYVFLWIEKRWRDPISYSLTGKKQIKKDWYDVFVNDKNNQALNIYSMVKEGKNSIEIQMNIEKDEDGLKGSIVSVGFLRRNQKQLEYHY